MRTGAGAGVRISVFAGVESLILLNLIFSERLIVRFNIIKFLTSRHVQMLRILFYISQRNLINRAEGLVFSLIVSG